MASPIRELPEVDLGKSFTNSSEDERTVIDHGRHSHSVDSRALRDRLQEETNSHTGTRVKEPRPSFSRDREEASRLNDDLAMMRAERSVTDPDKKSADDQRGSAEIRRSRSRGPDPVDEFDAATNPLHERTALYKPPEHPTTNIAKFFKYIHSSSWLVRYVTYIVPVVILLLIPLLIGALLPRGQNSNVGGVELVWFSIWLEIVWLTLWAGRLVAKLIPWPLGLFASMFTNNSKKWRDLGKQLEIPATIFFWWLGVEISFLPTMKNHHVGGNRATKEWETTMNKIIISILVGATLNFVEKIIIQLIAISFHLRTYADRIELNKFQIGSLTKLYIYSKQKIAVEDAEFAEKPSGPASGNRTPAMYAEKAQEAVTKAVAKVGDLAGTVAGDFTGRKVHKSGHPHQVVLALLNTTSGSQVLARRLYRTFVRNGFETIFSGDLKNAFDNDEEADAAFSMFDKDLNGDISMEELEAVCVEIGRERKSITASLKDLDSVVGKLDDVLFFVVIVVTVLVLISLLSTSASGILTSAGSAVLALSWLFSATAQEFLQSVVFVFVKHPFDVGDRVSIYGNTGSTLKGDDYFVKEISLLYTEFKKLEGHVVQAPNSYLNTLFILNMRRSGGLAEAIPLVVRFGTTLEQIDALRQSLLEFVRAEKREYQGNIVTEIREVTEAYSLTVNIVFFYKSNWQNELLRLQRRNKFVCAMMMAMQEHGIEGPRRNNAGWNQETPYFVQLPQGAAPLSSVNGPRQEGADAGPPQPSILRRRAPSGSNTRGRSESVSQMAKRVDFSLGMRDVSSGDHLSDVYEERSRSRVTEAIRDANRLDEQRREEQRRIDEEVVDEHGATRAPARPSSREHKTPLSPVLSGHMHGGLLRRATAQSTEHARSHRYSTSSQETHRNRFLNRFGRVPTRSLDVMARDSLAEEGHAGVIDPRSGQVSSEAVRVDSVASSAADPAPPRAAVTARGGQPQPETIAMRHL